MSRSRFSVVFLALTLTILGSSAALAQNGPPTTIPPVPRGPLAVEAVGGGCSGCVCPLPKPTDPNTCDRPCKIPLNATLTNRVNADMVVQVTLTTFLSSGPDFCGNTGASSVQTYFIPARGAITIDFGQGYSGIFGGGVFTVHAEILDCAIPGFIGKTADASANFASVWTLCPGCQL